MAEIQVGSRVRSYDFESTRECYVEGTVERIVEIERCPRYEIRVERSVWKGQEEDFGSRPEFVIPPVNGTPMLFGGVTNCVVLVEAD